MISAWQNSIPSAAPTDPVAWAEEIGLKVDGHTFESERCPQALIPIRTMSLADKITKKATYIAPVQSGKSTAGELVLAYWGKYARGIIQFNWQDDLKAKERWKTRILAMLKSALLEWYDENICEAWLKHATILMQGVFSENALNSDTIPYQINEEVHLWKPGHLSMAGDRQTRIWNSKSLTISNACRANTQLHLAYKEGTMEQWETVCPVCGIKHAMHFRWNPDKPQEGGLRWNADTRLADGRPNYNKLAQTIRYQFPCGHEVMGDVKSRRTLNGDYSLPQNPGATMSHRSFISEAVSYYEISWLDLIKEWHGAIQALKAGDGTPTMIDGQMMPTNHAQMFKFVTRRECKFHTDESIPYSGKIIINNTVTKNREGLKGRAARFWFADKQRGLASRLEMVHYWLVIRDVMPNGDSMLVFEGMVQTDADLVARLSEFGCFSQSGAIDCGWDRSNVLQFCYRNNFNAQITSNQDKLFYHKEEKAYRIYSEIEPLCKQVAAGFPNKFPVRRKLQDGALVEELHPEEPRYWAIHRVASIKLLFFLRNHRQVCEQNKVDNYIKWELPGDISEDYRKQIESWEFNQKKSPTTNMLVEVCRQRYMDDHMLMCEAGIANLMSMSGIIPARLAQMGINEAIVSQPEITK